MFITDSETLKNFTTENRIWQGIPSIEVTKGGRIFSTFYSGGIKEELGNYSMLVMSDDGVKFSEPIAVAYDEKHRCFDPCIWIDPLERLWFVWSVMPDDDVYAVICENPDAEEIVWNKPKTIGKGIMLNKPTVLSTGEWLFPIAMWKPHVKKVIENGAYVSELNETSSGAFAYRSIDNGESFEKLGGADVEYRSYDEHMLLEFNDNHIGNYVRTAYGIGVSYSYDGCRTWTKGEDSGFGGPSSRFYIGRLKSGRIIHINHYKNKGRNNLTAMLSEDEGQTWKYKLLIDERDDVSYPDVKEAEDGFIYITYDRERGGFKNTIDEVYGCAREILYAKITEEDIINGKIKNPDSKLRCIISKLGRYKYENSNLFMEPSKFSDEEFAENLKNETVDNILAKLFTVFSINCVNMHKFENEKLDMLIEKFKSESTDRSVLLEIIKLIRNVTDIKTTDFPIVEKIKEIITEDIQQDIPLAEIAKRAGISQSYMMYRFKSVTGVSINRYKTAFKIVKAKKLLVNTDKAITDIATECGFNSMWYFSERFMQSEGVTPSKYRKLLKK